MSALSQSAAGSPNAGKGVYRRILGDRSFRRLWLSQAVSGIGDWLVVGLLIPLVTQLSGGSSFAVAGIMIAKIIPSLVFSSFIGVLVDRFDRRSLMILCDLVRAVLVLGLVFTESLLVIYTIVLVTEVASLFHSPAKNALIPMLVEEDDLAAANGLSYTTQQASMLVGLTASGAILALFERVVAFVLETDLPVVELLVGPVAPHLLGPRAGVFLDSLTFLVSALLVGLMTARGPARARARLRLRLLGHDIVQSYRFLREHRELRGFLVTIGFAILGGGAIIPVGLIHIQQNLTGGLAFLGELLPVDRLVATPQTFILVFLALGMVVGALLVPRLSQRLSLQLLFVGGVVGFGVGMIGFASVTRYWAATLFATVIGLCLASVSVSGYTYVAEAVADGLRGRVFTAMESVVRVALLLSMVITAPLGDFVGGLVRQVAETRGASGTFFFTGPRLTLLFAATLVIGAAIYGFRRLEWRREESGSRDD